MSGKATKRVGSLRIRAAAVAVGGFVATLSVAPLIRGTIPEDALIRWTVVAALTFLGQVLVLWLRLDQNRSLDGTTRFESLGPANTVTVVRGLFLAWVTGFAVSGSGALGWVAALLYGLAAGLDAVDGFVARRTRESRLGVGLDTTIDAFGLLVGSLVGVQIGAIPTWYLAIGVARYAYLGGLWLRRRRGLGVEPLPTRTSRRLLAGGQMLFVFVALTPVTPSVVSSVGAVLVGVPFLLGFLRDWLYVSGRLTRPNRSSWWAR